jgi:hypothetical protein
MQKQQPFYTPVVFHSQPVEKSFNLGANLETWQENLRKEVSLPIGSMMVPTLSFCQFADDSDAI